MTSIHGVIPRDGITKLLVLSTTNVQSLPCVIGYTLCYSVEKAAELPQDVARVFIDESQMIVTSRP